MKKTLALIALALSPVFAFAAVKAVKGIELVSSINNGSQSITKYIDHDNGATCYTAQPMNSTNYSIAQVSISCFK